MNARLLGAVSACAITFTSLSAQAVPVSGQGTWETTLQPRDLDGNAATYEAYYDGTQYLSSKIDSFYALAVRPGDVSAVPVPAAVWLFGSGLMGLLGMARRKR